MGEPSGTRQHGKHSAGQQGGRSAKRSTKRSSNAWLLWVWFARVVGVVVPPFNISDWGGEKYENDPRWQYGRPPAGNANDAWLQHILWKLKPGGQAGVILANGSMSSNQSGEGQIREAMVRGDVVEVMVALPGQLFFNTQIPACVWFLTIDKTQRGRDRRGETLFIDARQMGTMETRVNRVLTEADIAKIAGTVGIIGSCQESNSPKETIVIGRVGTYCGSLHFIKEECWVTDNAIKAVAKKRRSQ
jgi:hypothetical protein